jgi:hypothetical protein
MFRLVQLLHSSKVLLRGHGVFFGKRVHHYVIVRGAREHETSDNVVSVLRLVYVVIVERHVVLLDLPRFRASNQAGERELGIRVSVDGNYAFFGTIRVLEIVLVRLAAWKSVEKVDENTWIVIP